MNASGKVEIELRLLTEKALKTAKDFGAAMGSALGGSKVGGTGGGGASPIEKAGQSVDSLTSKMDRLKNSTAAAKKQLEDWRKSIPAPTVTMSDSRSAELNRLLAYRAQGLRGYNAQAFFAALKTGGAGGLANPGAAGLASGLPDLSGKKEADAEKLKNFKIAGGPVASGPSGMFGAFVQTFAALAAFRVSVGLVSYALNALTVPAQLLKRLWENQYVSQARSTYASSLTSGGMPVGFTAYRQGLASVLGVGERDVFRFAEQVEWLNKHLLVANRSMTSANKLLTEQSWRARILHANWNAFMSELNAKFGTVTHNILLGLNSLIERTTKWMHSSNQAVSVQEEIKRWKYEGNHVNRLMTISRAGQLLTGKAHPSDKETADAIAKSTEEGYRKAMEKWRNIRGQPMSKQGMDEAMDLWRRVHGGGIPSPTLSANRLESSAWERMGLVVGAGGADGPAQRTANNTSKMINQLAAIHNALLGGTGRMAYKKPVGAAHP